jgi:hypothetical protein
LQTYQRFVAKIYDDIIMGVVFPKTEIPLLMWSALRPLQQKLGAFFTKYSSQQDLPWFGHPRL